MAKMQIGRKVYLVHSANLRPIPPLCKSLQGLQQFGNQLFSPINNLLQTSKSLQGLQGFDGTGRTTELYRKTSVRNTTQTMNDNLIDKLDEMGMLHFVIVSLFSAETLVDAESCEKSLKGVRELRAELTMSKYQDDSKIKNLLDDAEEIIKRDWKQFKRPSQPSVR